MARYNVLAFCSYCGRTHPARLTLTLKGGGPTKKATVAEAYKEQSFTAESRQAAQERDPMSRIGEPGNAKRP